MPRSRSTSRNSPSSPNSPNSITIISSPITTPDEFFNLSPNPPQNITMRRSNITPITSERSLPSYENIVTPPDQNVTIRRPRTPGAPQRRRSLTMDDEDIYNTLLNLDNDMNSSYSLLDSPEWFVDVDDNYVSPSEQLGINAAVPDSYERRQKYDITGLSNKKLDNHKGNIKIKKTQTIYDVIMMEDTNIHDYIKEDADNIVFLYENNYYLSTKSRVSEIIDMTTTENAIVFDCTEILDFETIRQRILLNYEPYKNVIKDYPYILINKLGIILNEFTNVISLENAIAITKPTSGQYFIIKGSDEVLISTVTDNVLFGRYANLLGASHCQGGKHAIVFDIQKFKPTYVNESTSPKSSKSPKSPKSKTKKNKKIKCINKKSCKRRLK